MITISAFYLERGIKGFFEKFNLLSYYLDGKDLTIYILSIF